LRIGGVGGGVEGFTSWVFELKAVGFSPQSFGTEIKSLGSKKTGGGLEPPRKAAVVRRFETYNKNKYISVRTQLPLFLYHFNE
jgi:hypothetical protein